MANYLAANVQVITSTAAPVPLPMMKRITAIKYFGGVNSSAAVLAGSAGSTGNQIWFENRTGATSVVTDLLSIYDSSGVTVSLGGGAIIFIYGTVAQRGF